MGNVVPPPPHPFPKALHTTVLASGTALHRIFSARYAGQLFNGNTERLHRFSPAFDRNGDVIPVLYAGASLRSAIYESVFHDAPPKGSKRRTLPVRALEEKQYGVWHTRRELKLATLHAPDLARFDVTLDQLIATNAKYYVQTARWADAIHAHHPDVDGLEWPSYRASPELAFVLFGDRVRDGDLRPPVVCRDVLRDAALFNEVLECGRRLGVRVHATAPARLGLPA